MSIQQETGHARNVGNLNMMVSFLESYGQTYQPVNSDLKISSLNTLIGSSQDCIHLVNTAYTEWTKASGARQQAFGPLSKLVTRICGALASCGVDKHTLDVAATIKKAISGTTKRRTKADDETSDSAVEIKLPRTISTSHMSFDFRIENFDKLIILLKATPQYQPNEKDLTVENLEILLTTLRDANDSVAGFTAALSKARIRRNEIMYAPVTGIHSRVAAIKAYVKSIFGATSPQYKQISRIRFSTVKP